MINCLNTAEKGEASVKRETMRKRVLKKYNNKLRQHHRWRRVDAPWAASLLVASLGSGRGENAFPVRNKPLYNQGNPYTQKVVPRR